MSLAESISHALNGKESGQGFRVKSVCHGGNGYNLYICDAPDGKLLATCFSHGCSYKKIMECLESLGVKPKDHFNRSVQRQHISKRQYREALFIEMHILLQFISSRNGDTSNSKDPKYLKPHPEYTRMPEEAFEREIQAAKRTIKLIGKVYGV